MKKIVSLLLCLMLLATLAACVDPNENNEPTATAEQSTAAQTEGESSPSTAETDENDGWTNIY